MRKWGPLFAVCLGSFMLLVDVTIVVVALPDMGRDLHSSYSGLQWVLDAYALALAALLMAVGSLADRVGHRRVYLAGTAVFTAASLACALAPNTPTLVAARTVQGMGGAAMFATTLALIGHTYTGRDRGVAFGVWGAVNGVSAATGPVLGGLLTQHVGWQAIFLVNLPVGVVTVWLSTRLLTEARSAHPAPTDVPGTVSFTLAAASVTYALVRAGEHGWTDTVTLVVFAVSACSAVVFVVVELATSEPMLDVRLFTRPAFTGIMLAGALVQFVAFAHTPQISLWLQSLLGYGPVKAGLVLLPTALASFVVSALAGRFLHGASPRWSVGGGLLAVGAGALLLGRLDSDSSWPVLVPGLVLIGVGVGLAVPQLAAAALGAVPAAKAGVAGGALNTFRQLGFALGVAVVGVVFQSGAEHSLQERGTADPHGAASALAQGQAGALVHASPAPARGHVEHVLHVAFADGLDRAFLTCGVLGLVGGALVLVLVGRRGQPVPPQQTSGPRGDGTRGEHRPSPGEQPVG